MRWERRSGPWVTPAAASSSAAATPRLEIRIPWESPTSQRSHSLRRGESIKAYSFGEPMANPWPSYLTLAGRSKTTTRKPKIYTLVTKIPPPGIFSRRIGVACHHNQMAVQSNPPDRLPHQSTPPPSQPQPGCVRQVPDGPQGVSREGPVHHRSGPEKAWGGGGGARGGGPGAGAGGKAPLRRGEGGAAGLGGLAAAKAGRGCGQSPIPDRLTGGEKERRVGKNQIRCPGDHTLPNETPGGLWGGIANIETSYQDF